MGRLHFNQNNWVILETADLYEPPLDMFGADAVERWFSESDIRSLITFAKQIQI